MELLLCTKRKLYVLDRTSTTSQKMHALLIRLFLVLKNDIENHIQNKWSFLYAAFWLVQINLIKASFGAVVVHVGPCLMGLLNI